MSCGHRCQMTSSEGCLYLFEPFGIDWSGAVDHQNPHQVVFEPFFGHQTIAGKNLFCSWMPEEIEVASFRNFLCLCPRETRFLVALVHMVIVSRAACNGGPKCLRGAPLILFETTFWNTVETDAVILVAVLIEERAFDKGPE
jgi:hypothetical protein